MKPCLLLSALLLLASCGKSAGAPDVQVSDAWAREGRSAQSAAYMTIANRGSGDDRLVSVAAPAPAKAMLHGTASSGGISSMRPMDHGLAVPAGATVPLKPGGAHVMLTGLASPLKRGERLRLTLRFERSGERPVDVQVVGATER